MPEISGILYQIINQLYTKQFLFPDRGNFLMTEIKKRLKVRLFIENYYACLFFCVIGLVETEKLVEGVSEGVVKGTFTPKPA